MSILLAIIFLIIGIVIGVCLALAALDQQYRVEKKELEDERKKARLLRRDLKWLTELYGDLLEEKSPSTTFAEVA